MRLDARNGDSGWPCYDAKRCCMVQRVMWVDDLDATWGELVGLTQRGSFNVVTHQEERITIHQSRRLVVFNEVDAGDQADEKVADAISRPRETA
jgi:hypothetical protein